MEVRKSQRLSSKSAPPPPDPLPIAPPPPKKAKTSKERNQQYRTNILANPALAETYKEKERLRCKLYRAGLSEEQKANSNEKAKLRMQRYRERKKEQAKIQGKPNTRKNAEYEEEQRAKRREAKRRERENMTPQKKMWINKKRREKRAAEKALKEATKKAEVQRSADTQTDDLVECEARSSLARRQALHRAKKAMPRRPDHYAATLMDMCSKVSPRKKAALERRGMNIEDRRVCTVVLDAIGNLRKKNDLPSRKARHILLGIFEKYGSISKRSRVLRINRQTIVRHNKSNENEKTKRQEKSEETKNQISSFFEEKGVPLPDKKSVSKISGLPKTVLQRPVADYYTEYKKSGGCASLSYFAKCRPKEVKRMAAARLNQCLCEYCENAKLKISVLNGTQNNPCRIRHVYHAVALSTCENGGKSCAYRTCADCDIHKLADYLKPLEGHRGQFTWHRWTTKKIETDNKIISRKVLETRRGGITDLVQELLQEVAFLSEHLYRADWQHAQFEKLKNMRPLLDGLVLMVLDFAENFTCLYQHEIQAAHWHHQQVTIHPVSCYYRCPFGCENTVNESLIFISDDLKHDFHAVHSFTSQTIQHLRQNRNLNLKQIVQWSDGCSAQYKSRGPFADVTASQQDFGVKFQRNFFGSRHGKGPCDGEAAVIKSHVTNAVKAGTAVISSAEEFYNYCQNSKLNKQAEAESCKGHFLRTFFWVPKEAINRPRSDRSFKTVKGTRDFHQVMSAGFGRLLVRHLTCYCENCLSGIGDCSVSNIVGSWKEHTLVPDKDYRPFVQPDPVPGPAVPPPAPDPVPGPAVPPPAPDPVPGPAVPPPAPDPVPGPAVPPPAPDPVPGPAVPPPAPDPVPGPAVPPPAPDPVPGPAVPPPAPDPVPGPAVPPPAPDPVPGPAVPPPAPDPVPGPAVPPPAPDPVPGPAGDHCPEADDQGHSTTQEVEEKFRKGSWVRAVLRNWQGKKTSEYIGKVLSSDKEAEEVELKFLKSKGTHYIWPLKDDIAWVPMEDVRPIGNPDITARQHYYFE